jgi:hypothetical protein
MRAKKKSWPNLRYCPTSARRELGKPTKKPKSKWTVSGLRHFPLISDGNYIKKFGNMIQGITQPINRIQTVYCR